MWSDVNEFYPPSPSNVPASFTKPTLGYRLRALLVTLSLFLFLFVYLSLIAVCVGVSVLAFITLANFENRDQVSSVVATLMTVGTGFVALSFALLALYFIKGLFKFPRGDDHNGIEITENEHPRLFAFIRQLCKDTGAPVPAKIVLSGEVNASVFYTCNAWSLLFRIPMNLHIGLGLVNFVNLTEFKAVLAHELGHFSQRSMRFGAYVYTANRAIHEIIFGRDWLDETLSSFDPVLNVIRWMLGGIFRVVNFAHASLSRQMEFQADLVAVSVTGSDAVADGLLRIDFAQQCLDETLRDLAAAGDHALWTNDLFLHHQKAAEYLRILKDDPALGIPPPGGEKRAPVFPPDETVLPPMWASHPPHHLRERNCRRVYIAGVCDERPAWELFDNPDKLRQSVTARYYELTRKGVTVEAKPAETVQRFIDDERAETIYSARYHGMYEEGLISPGVIDKLTKSIPSRSEPPARLLKEHADIFNNELREHMAAYKERRKQRDRLARIAARIDIPKSGKFEFRGKQHKVGDVPGLLETLEQEIKADREHLAEIDRRIFLVYMAMAAQLDGVTAQDLDHRYRFHVSIQEMIGALTHWNREIQEAFAAVSGKRDPSPDGVYRVAEALREAQDAMGRVLARAASLRLPAFKHLKAGQPLSVFLSAKPQIHNLFGSQQVLDGTWINQIIDRHAEVIDKLRRVLFKSLGSLLCTQEKIGETWKARHGSAVASESPNSEFGKIQTDRLALAAGFAP
jgi:Zn-dependent protease with chaperone function